MENVRKRAAASGAILTDKQAEQLARDAIAGDAARRAADRPDGGGAGGGRTQSEFEVAAAQIQRETNLLNAEAAALVAVAASGREYGDAIEFARQKAELLAAAQADGLAITPELIAQTDKLAEAHTKAVRLLVKHSVSLEDADKLVKNAIEDLRTAKVTRAKGGTVYLHRSIEQAHQEAQEAEDRAEMEALDEFDILNKPMPDPDLTARQGNPTDEEMAFLEAELNRLDH